MTNELAIRIITGDVLSTSEETQEAVKIAVEALSETSAQPDYQEVLGWLLAYHTKSFDLHGRYLPHEVISWLISDFAKEFSVERRQDDVR